MEVPNSTFPYKNFISYYHKLKVLSVFIYKKMQLFYNCFDFKTTPFVSHMFHILEGHIRHVIFNTFRMDISHWNPICVNPLSCLCVIILNFLRRYSNTSFMCGSHTHTHMHMFIQFVNPRVACVCVCVWVINSHANLCACACVCAYVWMDVFVWMIIVVLANVVSVFVVFVLLLLLFILFKDLNYTLWPFISKVCICMCIGMLIYKNICACGFCVAFICMYVCVCVHTLCRCMRLLCKRNKTKLPF